MQKVIYGIALLLALLILIGLALPSTNRIEVSTEIDAHQATVFALVNDFRRFSHWAPWADKDPNARINYSGANRGVGAIMTWDSAIIGSGAQLISASNEYSHVSIVLNPGEPGEAKSWFDLTPGVGTTIVTWGFEADHGLNIVGRYFSRMLGGVVARDYQDGLSRLKDLAESLPGANFGDLRAQHVVVEASDIAYLSVSSRPELSAVSETMAKAYFQILNFIDKHGLATAGAPLSIMRNFSGSELAFDAAIPVTGLTVAIPRNGAGVRIGATHAGSALRVEHLGPYAQLSSTHRQISAYLAALGIERDGAAWESYVSDPARVSEKDLLTVIYYPVIAD